MKTTAVSASSVLGEAAKAAHVGDDAVDVKAGRAAGALTGSPQETTQPYCTYIRTPSVAAKGTPTWRS
jgi:phosphoglycolate phosphatase-like HAD superfamily hydrolase